MTSTVQMTCHPLLVDEVFRSIVEELIALSPRTVLSLALCCSSLTDVPLSVLWERQKRLSTLVKVLPCDAWAYEETESPAGQLVGRNHFQSHLQSTLNLPFVDHFTEYLAGRMGEAEEICFVDARTSIP